MNNGGSHISDAISGRQRLMDRFFQALTTGSAWLVLVILAGIIVSLFVGGWQALVTFGPKFLVTDEWNPVTEKFGALVPIYGTLISSLIARPPLPARGFFMSWSRSRQARPTK